MLEPTPPLTFDTDQAVVIIEPGTLAIRQASRRARSMLGYSDAQLETMSFTDVFLHPPADVLERLLGPRDQPADAELACAALLCDSSGRSIATELLCVRIETPGTPLVAAIFRLGPRPREGRGGQHLGPGNAAFVEFASRLGHDMNNLLGTVIGGLGLVREEGLGGGDDDTRQLVDDVLSASRECADLLERLMAAAGKQRLRPQKVSANSLIERLTPLLARTLPADIELSVSLAPDLPDICVDPDRLEAAIIALVVNARESMPGGGELLISSAVGAASGTTALEADREYLKISVSDTGQGIPEHLVDQVVEPLFTTKSDSSCRGLGLSIVNGFVHQSHGAMSLDAAPKGGTRVTLHFPQAD